MHRILFGETSFILDQCDEDDENGLHVNIQSLIGFLAYLQWLHLFGNFVFVSFVIRICPCQIMEDRKITNTRVSVLKIEIAIL